MNLLTSPPRSGWNFIASVRNLFLITVAVSLDESLRISTVSPIIFNASSSLPPGRVRGSRLRLRLLLRRRRRPCAWRSRSRAFASLAAASASACSLCFLLSLAARLFSLDACLRCSSRRCFSAASSARLPALCFSLGSLTPFLGLCLSELSVAHAHAVPLTHYSNRETVSIVGHHKSPASTSRNPHR